MAHRLLQTLLLSSALLVALPGVAEDTSSCFDAVYDLNEGRLDEAVKHYSDCIGNGELSDKNLIVAHNDRGNAYGRLGRHQLALQDFNRVIALNPADPDAYYNRGLTYKKLNQPDLALRDYTEAISRKPRYAKAFNNRGAIYGARGLFIKALEDFNQAVELSPRNASAYYNRGLAHYSLGNYAQAINDLERAIQLDERYAKAYEQLAWLRATCPDNSFRDGVMAVALARKARFLSPAGNPMLYDILAAAYARQGNFDHAIRYQELAIESAAQTRDASRLKSRLDLYQSGRQYADETSNRFLPNS